MAQKHNPTNLDIIKELKSMQLAMTDHGARIGTLESWKIAEVSAKKAVDEYKAEERQGNSGNYDKWLNKELVKALGLVITAVLGLIAYLRSTK